MAIDRRMLAALGGGALLGAAAMALITYEKGPGPVPAPRAPEADPHIPVAPGTPNAIGQLALEGGEGPRVPTVDVSTTGPRRFVTSFIVGGPLADPSAGWPCVRAVGEWAVAELDAGRLTGEAMANAAVASACTATGSSAVEGKLRLATRAVPGKGGGAVRQRCEVTVQYGYTDAAGKELRPEVRHEATADAHACAAALAGLEAGFRSRLSGAP